MIGNIGIGNGQFSWGNISRIFLHLSVVSVFMTLLVATSAFGQSTSWYSDAWADDYSIYGSGVSESAYNTWSHEFRVVTHMTSPNGRTATHDTGYGSATSFVSLGFDENDLGTYNVYSSHYDFCPMGNQEMFYGSSGAAVKMGVSLICYDWYGYNPATQDCFFMIQSDCPVTKCNAPTYSRPKEPGYYCPNKVQVKYLWQEKQNGCSCEITCTKTSDGPIYDSSPCNCAQIPPN